MYEELEEALIMSDIGMDTTVEIIDRLKAKIRKEKTDTFVSSSGKFVRLNSDKFITIGERINPSSKKTLAEDLKLANILPVIDMANEQTESGADILDINISAVKVDEKAIMKKIALELPV